MPTLLVTGAAPGPGRYVAFEPVRGGHPALAHGRGAGRTGRLVEELREGGDTEGFVAGPACPARVREPAAQVREPAAQVTEACPGLDVLIGNAGVGFGAPGAGREPGADGHEPRPVVSHLATAVLARALPPVPLVPRANASARIVDAGPAGQEPVDFAGPELARGHGGVPAYCRGTCAPAALAGEPAGTGVAVDVPHPAASRDTAVVREAGVGPRRTVADGARGVLAPATGDAGTGGRFDGTRPARAHAAARGPEVRGRPAVAGRLLGM
ncbi:3-oxoacyl-ACP reductase [Streptomyces sp. NPDC085946]|uniref:3-oxoacyl-ACP reductase n=1 Tax=Streptomyces sp. NPDC085946 TaxID=3365744 RepID=UPI0037D00B3C